MKTNKIPNTDLKVSAICLGTMTFGTPVGEPDAIELVHYALDKGINFIDTANMYEGYARVPGSSGGIAEEIIGKAVKGRRNGVIIATKLGMKVGDEPEDMNTSPAAIKKQLGKSLINLGTDMIDIYYLHKYDPTTPPEEIVYALDQAKREGKIRYYAVSNYNTEQLKALIKAADDNGLPRPVMCQPPLSILKQEALGDIIHYCDKEKISVVPYQILQGGLLTGKYKRGHEAPAGSRKAEKPDWVWDMDDKLYDKLEDIEKMASEAGITMTQFAINWSLQQPTVVSAIVGVKTKEQIDEAVNAVG